MKNKKRCTTQAHKQLGFKWLGVRRSRLQAFCSVDKKASTTSPTAYSLVRCAQAKKTRQIDQFIAYRKIHPPHTQAHLAAQPTSDRFAAKRAFVFQRTL